MTAALIGSFTPGSPEWHAARRNGVGGSEVAAILGLSPWESRFSLYHRKRGDIGEQTETPAMSWGTRLEPVILDKFFEDHPELERYRENATWRNDERPWQIANPDALAWNATADRTELVEVKTARNGDDWGPSGSDTFPIHYRCQVLHYLDTLGLQRAHLVVLIAGSDYREYVIEYDETEALFLRSEVAKFVDDLANDVRPDIDGHTATYSTVKALPEGVVDETAFVDAGLAQQYRDALAAHTEAEVRKRECTSRLLDLIGDRRHIATHDGVRVATRALTKDGRTHSLRAAKERTS